MKKFLIKIILFVLPILVVAAGLELSLRRIPNIYKHKNDYLSAHAGEIETLILGSSHTFYGIDPQFLDSRAFNLSHPSQTLDIDYLLLKKYGGKMSSLKTLVVPVSVFTLYGRLGTGVAKWRMNNYALYYDIKTSNKLGQWFEILARKFQFNAEVAFDYYVRGEEELSCSDLGWGTAYRPEDAKDLVVSGDDAAKRHCDYDFRSRQYEDIFRENVETLRKIVSWSEARSVHVVLLLMPAYETYRTSANLDRDILDITIDTSTEFAEEYDNCSYLNLYECDRFEMKDYYDADHLNHDGVEKMSKMLDAYIRNQYRSEF